MSPNLVATVERRDVGGAPTSTDDRTRFFDLSVDMLCIATFSGHFVDVNAAFTRVLGYSREELLSQPFVALIHPDDVAKTEAEMASLSRGSETLNFENRYRHKNGHYLTLNWSSTSDPEAGRVFAVARDITESFRNAEMLARTLKILNETSSIAKVGGWELDVATGELEWTAETFRILEVEKKAGQKPMLPEGLKLFTPACQPIIEQAVARAIELGEPYSLELEAQTAKGNVLWVYTNGKANYENGEVVSLSGTIQDIHARKTAELRYEAERRRVIHDAKMASLGQLAASMAHELNNPLGIVSAYAELALESPDLAPSLTESLERVLKSCDRMAHIVGNLKRFSRSELERNDHQSQSLNQIIEEALVLARPRLKGEMVRVDFEPSADVRISCSEIELEQVLVNLLNNSIDAIRALPEKWISIATVDRGAEVEVRVTDSGSGIPEAELESIFTPFHTTKNAGEGTGLGLAISRAILEDHGARLHYDPESEHTCFRMTFPKLEEAP